MNDLVNSPAHYMIGSSECKELIEDRGDRAVGFYWGNALKYLVRAGMKDGEAFMTAIRKAHRNLTYLIEYMGDREE